MENAKELLMTADGLKKLEDELGDDYDEDVFRLVRIKFLSEQANGKRH